ncbi:thiamine pyrophosphate-binding protein [Thermus thermamylovorans]|uniref:Benzoylformate decarboxylase n=1 Tax=Thermus thermamylovorans TaxID=2509362 RepID=A0A4Q9AXR0_9DEIN|nr:thiamine pyrophosphate-binding protein [Thermus thermamylovorans]TBH16056.1 benzoylformate decarboxylase [Thermus thermamylovorans]
MKARESAHRWLQEREISFVFGNPGSTELPFLLGLEKASRYVLALHEGVAVAMAEGYAQASGQVAFVNLHAAPGLGNAIGALYSALKNRSPLLVTVGHQDRRHLFREPLLSGPLLEMARSVSKAVWEVHRGEDLPEALERAYHLALTPPRGPVVAVLPMDLWEEEAAPPRLKTLLPPGAPQGLEALASALSRAENPALILGGGSQAPAARKAALRLVEALPAVVFSDPIGPRHPFPTSHPLYRGVLPPVAAQLRNQLAPHDLVLVVGAPCFLLYPYTPGPPIPEGSHVVLLTDDPAEAARAEAHEVYLGDVAEGLRLLAGAVRPSGRPWPSRPPSPPSPPAPLPSGPRGLNPLYVVERLAQALTGRFVVDEAISLSPPFRKALKVEEGRYLHSASGGLGFAPAAAVGAALAGEAVAAVVGDGAFLFAPQALYTAKVHGLDVAFIVLNNAGYGILKGFAEALYPGQGERVPGLSLSGVDFLLLAQAFGVQGWRADTPEALEEGLAYMGQGPFLLEIRLDPTPHRIF